MIIKVCGMTNAENIRQIESSGIDLIGHIFYPQSPRYVSETGIPPHPAQALSVGVFVNQDRDTILRTVKAARLDYVQLHGTESPELCRTLHEKGIGIIKAFAIAAAKDLSETNVYEGTCDYYLFDTKCTAYGGSGRAFDWNTLQHYAGRTPFLLSGGIGIDSLPALREFTHPMLAGYDLNSRFETSPGIKDAGRIRRFLQEITTI